MSDLLAKLEKLTYSTRDDNIDAESSGISNGVSSGILNNESSGVLSGILNNEPSGVSNNVSNESKDNTNPKPPPVQPVVEQKYNACYVIRDKIYPVLTTDDIFRLGFQLDSDIYQYELAGGISKEQLFSNRGRYITNGSFTDAVGINSYLREWGKIPAFLEVKSGSKGYGVYTHKSIPKMTFLGFYEGQYRPANVFHSNDYGYNFRDFNGAMPGYIDAENMTFANWTRFINDGVDCNVEFAVYNNSIYVFALHDIAPNEELLGSYGDDYWKQRESLKKLD